MIELIEKLGWEKKTDKEIIAILRQVEEAGQEIAQQIQDSDGLVEIAHEVMANAGLELFNGNGDDLPEHQELISAVWVAAGKHVIINNTTAR